MLDRILKALFNSLLGYIELWWMREKKTAAEWAAKTREGQLRGIKSTEESEIRINKPLSVEPSKTAGKWNLKAGRGAGLLILVCLLFSGCFTRYVYVESKWPAIERPARPTLPEEPVEFTGREVILAKYAEMLEIRIKLYNLEAKRHNEEHGY